MTLKQQETRTEDRKSGTTPLFFFLSFSFLFHLCGSFLTEIPSTSEEMTKSQSAEAQIKSALDAAQRENEVFLVSHVRRGLVLMLFFFV